MTDTAPTQTDPIQDAINALQNEYLGLCSRAGETNYLISTKRKELALLNKKLRFVNKKAAKLIEQKNTRDQAVKVSTLKAVPQPETTPEATA